jgi:hypothetical protein
VPTTREDVVSLGVWSIAVRSGVCLLSAFSLALPALGADPDEAAQEGAVREVVAGPEYAAGGFKEFFLGSDYRDLWTTPFRVEVMALDSVGGGLTPVRRVGGQQSKGLALEGRDGRDYTFRAIDKDPSAILPEDLQGTIVDDFVKDQIAASHPAATLVADELSKAAGVPTVDIRLVVMADDPALGEFREAFAGVLGTISVYPRPVSDTNPGFEGATEIVDHLELYARIRKSPADRVDAEAFLRARLLDVFMGDWDRHRKQWRWALFPGREGWQAIPEDHDQALSRFEGLVLAMGRPRQPRFVVFGPEYPRMLGLTWNGWEQDRVLLTGLEWPVWEKTARELQARLTDEVIDRAAHRMPREYFAIDGERLITALRKRRDTLVEAAHTYYRLLAGEVEVHGTDEAELAEMERRPNGDLEVRLSALGADGVADSPPFYRRVFHDDETQEVRVYLHGGDDHVDVRGGRGGIRLRVVGGGGRDYFDDSEGGGTRFYDESTTTDLQPGPGTHLDRRPYEAPVPVPRVPWLPPRDWGHRVLSVPYSGWSADYGLFLGAGLDIQTYGFRKNPYSSRHVIRGGWAFRPEAGRFDYRGEFRRENSGAYWSLHAFASGLQVLHFHGFGNETPDTAPDDFYKVNQSQYLFAPAFTLPVVGKLDLSVAPVVRYATTHDNEGRLIGVVNPYGAGRFGQVGGLLRLDLDTRDNEAAATRGVHLQATVAGYPAWWDVEKSFGGMTGDVSTYLTARGHFETTLAVRAGGQQMWGDYPFFEAAYVGGGGFFGGSQTVRGLAQNRYAGDAALYGNAELRTRLGRVTLVLPADVGVFALADVGRVFYEGETSHKWHPGYGGGFWLSYLERNNTVTVAVATSEGRTGLYIRLGFAF